MKDDVPGDLIQYLGMSEVSVSQQVSRRGFLKVSGGALAWAGAMSFLSACGLVNPDGTPAPTGPDVPHTVPLTPEQKQAIRAEGWQDLALVDLGPDYDSLLPEGQQERLRQKSLEFWVGVIGDMADSADPVFAQTARIIKENLVDPEDPNKRDGFVEIALESHVGTQEPYTLATIFSTQANGAWGSRMGLTTDYFDPDTAMSHIPDFTFNRATYALTLVHEILGHRRLTNMLISESVGAGNPLTDGVLVGIDRGPPQEPYSYAVTAAAMLPLLNGVLEPRDFPLFYLELAAKWSHDIEGAKPPKSWADPEWMDYIFNYLRTPVGFLPDVPVETLTLGDVYRLKKATMRAPLRPQAFAKRNGKA